MQFIPTAVVFVCIAGSNPAHGTPTDKHFLRCNRPCDCHISTYHLYVRYINSGSIL